MSEINEPNPQTQQAPDVILTGATGLIGRWLLLELLRRGRRVLALVRNAQVRQVELSEWALRHGVEVDGLRTGEFSLDDWARGAGSLDDLEVSEVQDVFHLAARFEFGLAPEVARAANVDASIRFLEASSRLPRLRRYVSVSGYRVSSAHGEVSAEHYSKLGAYEASKLEEHALLRRRAEELGVALNVVNPCSVIGDSESGETLQKTGVGEVVQQLFDGKMPAQVGSPRTFVPLVAVDRVARFMAELPLQDVAGGEYWLLHPDSPNLPELIERIAQTMGVQAPSLRLPVGVVRVLPRALTGAEPESLSFLSEDRYPSAEGDRLSAAWGLERTDFDQSLRAWVGYLVGTRFLRRKSRAPRFYATRAGQILAEGGEGSNLVLLHGLPLDATSWDPLLAELSEPALVVDLPGLGRSGAQHPGFDWADSGWLEDLPLPRRACLVGHSLGCAPALDYALTHPEQVEEVLLVAPAFLGAGMARWLRCQPLMRGVFRFGGPRQLESQLFGADRPVGLEALVESTYESLQRAHVRRSVAAALAWAGDPAVRRRTAEKLAAVSERGVSVRVLWGERDGALAQNLPPRVRAQVLPEAGHYPQLTHPQRLAAWLREETKSTGHGVEVARQSTGS